MCFSIERIHFTGLLQGGNGVLLYILKATLHSGLQPIYKGMTHPRLSTFKLHWLKWVLARASMNPLWKANFPLLSKCLLSVECTFYKRKLVDICRNPVLCRVWIKSLWVWGSYGIHIYRAILSGFAQEITLELLCCQCANLGQYGLPKLQDFLW